MNDADRPRDASPNEALQRVAAGAVLIDVREPGEWAQGSPRDAWRVPLATLAARIVEEIPDRAQPLFAICASGTRSTAAVATLRALGYRDVRSVDGGFRRWQREGLPFEIVSSLDADARARYARHLLLPQVGEAGQLALARATVLVVGAGGLGSPAALYLAAAGIGTLRLVDDDVVDLSNLQRQVLHTSARVGRPKVASAKETLAALNPRVAIDAIDARVAAANVEALVRDADVVLDGSDNFATRFLLNDACVHLGKPLVYGAIHRFEGQVSVFWPGRPGAPGPCYRCLFAAPPAPEDAPNCAAAGVLGVLPGIVGALQAAEALKLVLGIGEPLVGRLLHVETLGMRFREVRLPRDPQCPGCGPDAPRGVYADWETICASR